MKRFNGPAIVVLIGAVILLGLGIYLVTTSIVAFKDGDVANGWGSLIVGIVALLGCIGFIVLGVDELKLPTKRKEEPRWDTYGGYYVRIGAFEKGANAGIEDFIESFRDEYGNLNMYKKVIRVDGKRTFTEFVPYSEVRMIDRQADAVDEVSHQESKRLRERV